jgi:hypothetical protein
MRRSDDDSPRAARCLFCLTGDVEIEGLDDVAQFDDAGVKVVQAFSKIEDR